MFKFWWRSVEPNQSYNEFSLGHLATVLIYLQGAALMKIY